MKSTRSCGSLRLYSWQTSSFWHYFNMTGRISEKYGNVSFFLNVFVFGNKLLRFLAFVDIINPSVKLNISIGE